MKPVFFFILISCLHFSTYSVYASPIPSDVICGDTLITKEKAISIARQKNYYDDQDLSCIPEVNYDPCGYRWIISSVHYEQRNKGKCAPSGCTVRETKTIIINACDGKVLYKNKELKVYANEDR